MVKTREEESAAWWPLFTVEFSTREGGMWRVDIHVPVAVGMGGRAMELKFLKRFENVSPYPAMAEAIFWCHANPQ